MNTAAAAVPMPAAAAPRWPWALIAALMLLQCWTAAGMAGTPDTLRDLYFAQQLASGAQWPLTGPVIYNTLHLGPLWYYLLGAALWLLPHPLTVPLATAAIAALKYPLAYLIGRRYGGTRLGLLFALAFFVPGWSSFILAAMTHTTVVEAALLFGAWAALHYREAPGAGRALLLGLAAAAMFHAHPTALLLGSLLVVYAIAAAPRSALRDGGLVALVGLASLAPMFVEQWQAGFGDLATLDAYAGRDPALPTLSRLGALLLSLAGYGAEYTLRFWLETPAPLRRALMLLHLGALLVCVLLALSAPSRERRRIALAMLALLPLQSLFVLALRPITPYWMVFAHLPLIAALLALGLERCCELGRRGQLIAAALLGIWSAWSLCIHYALSHPPEQALVAVADGERNILMNVTRRASGGERHNILLLAFRDRYAITAPLCEPATLYAHYAVFIDESLGTGLLARCGHKDQIQIGGPPAGRALVGLRDYAWRTIGATPAQRITQLGYSPVSGVLQAGPPLPAAVPGSFPAHPGLRVDPQDFVIRGDSATGEFVVVAHRAAFHEPFEVKAAQAGGSTAEALYRDHATAIYRAPRDAVGRVAWELTVHASRDHVDVVSFADAAPP